MLQASMRHHVLGCRPATLCVCIESLEVHTESFINYLFHGHLDTSPLATMASTRARQPSVIDRIVEGQRAYGPKPNVYLDEYSKY